MKRYGFIYNPEAGQKASLNILQDRVDTLPKANLFSISDKANLPDIIKQISADYDVIVACGGDGTIREVASHLLNTDITLGVIPLGSGNDLVKSLNIPKDLHRAFEILLRGDTINMDVGRCNEFIFLNTLGFGFDGLVNKYSHDCQRLRGVYKYVYSALKANWRRQNITVKIQGQNKSSHQELLMVTIANGRAEGGSFWIAPKASVNDGKLCLVTIKPVSKWLLPLAMPLVWLKRLKWLPQYRVKTIENLQLVFEGNVDIHADGEIIASNQRIFNISVLPAALKVKCNLSATV